MIRSLLAAFVFTALLPIISHGTSQAPVVGDTGSVKHDNPLTGTQWRLVRFQSMNDTIGEIKPDNPLAYTLTLNADGTVQMQLNCNRAAGTWFAEATTGSDNGSFTFGQLATTKVLCPPPSMDERVARDAEWIRSYLLKNGQLHLSLMADGGIYYWEPIIKGGRGCSFATRPDPALEEALRAAAPEYTREVMAINGKKARYVYGMSTPMATAARRCSRS